MALDAILKVFPSRLNCMGSPGEGLARWQRLVPDDRSKSGLIILFSTIMEIIEIPKGQSLVQLSSREILVLWTALADARKRMDEESFMIDFKITPARAYDLLQKLGDAMVIVHERRA